MGLTFASVNYLPISDIARVFVYTDFWKFWQSELHTVSDYRYTLHTTTHSDSGTPMQDTVILYLYGRDGCSGPLIAGSGKDGLFKPGTTHEIKVV